MISNCFFQKKIEATRNFITSQCAIRSFPHMPEPEVNAAGDSESNLESPVLLLSVLPTMRGSPVLYTGTHSFLEQSWNEIHSF